jgi:predicted nuclease of predicted toxin-antitoxin system
MRLLLDELCPPGIAEALRGRGHDVVSLHDPSHRHLRGRPDREVLVAAANERRAVVTDDARHFLPIHRDLLAVGRTQHGLVCCSNRSFPRHRADVFVRAMVRALDELLTASGDEPPAGHVVWLGPDQAAPTT